MEFARNYFFKKQKKKDTKKKKKQDRTKLDLCRRSFQSNEKVKYMEVDLQAQGGSFI